MKIEDNMYLPDTDEIEEVYRAEYDKILFLSMVRSSIFILTVVSAVAILTAVLLLPVLRIYGQSMQGSLNNGDIVVSMKSIGFKPGDVIAFYYNNNILVKRVIASSGDWVDMDQDGNVYVNGVLLEEDYIEEKAYGETNIELPFQVPDGRIFVMGDNREASIDSRNKTIGTIAGEQIVGKLVFRVWPFSAMGMVK